MNIRLILHKFVHCILFGCIYFVLESIWKCHWTDWRMFLLSGLIGLAIGCINELFDFETHFALQCIVGMMIALLCECIFGYEWNVVQNLALWDYSNIPFSAVEYQINLFFGLIWIVLSAVCILLDDALHYYIWKEGKRPFYKFGNRVLYLPKRI